MENYRPISVLNSFSKIFELVVHEQLYEFLETNGMLGQSQFGFRKNRSTQHAVTLLTDQIRQGMDRGKFTGSVFVDLSKAFDTVDHGCVLSKLKCYGIKEKEFCWFESYLFGRKQYVAYDNTNSEIQSVLCGVPQGSVLGPLLFVILMNDLEIVLDKCKIILYADDTVLCTSNTDINLIVSELNHDLKLMSNWFYNNNLTVNMKKGKTEYTIFGTERKLSKLSNVEKLDINMNGSHVNRTRSYKYLGVTLDQSLNYIDHLNKIYKKASSKVKLLSKVRNDMSPHVAETIFRMMISPIFHYCSNIFLYNNQVRFQRIQDRAQCIVYGRKHQAWRSIVNERKIRCAVDVFRCLNNTSPGNFENYFTRLNHSLHTRGNKSSIKLPKVRTESGRKSFSFQGGLVFNELPREIRNETSIVRFKNKCKEYFI